MDGCTWICVFIYRSQLLSNCLLHNNIVKLYMFPLNCSMFNKEKKKSVTITMTECYRVFELSWWTPELDNKSLANLANLVLSYSCKISDEDDADDRKRCYRFQLVYSKNWICWFYACSPKIHHYWPSTLNSSFS